jgi:hypothetical protein
MCCSGTQCSETVSLSILMISTAAYFKGVERLQTLQQFIVRTSSNSWTLFEHKLADPVELAFKKIPSHCSCGGKLSKLCH